MLRLFIKQPLEEMATVYSDANYGILVTVNPDPNRVGDPYFKFFNSVSYKSATKAVRIYFKKLGYTYHRRDGKKLWKMNAKELNILMTILKTKSAVDPKYSVWDMAKFYWNNEYFGAAFNMEEYFKGTYDEDPQYKDHPSFVKASEELRDYTQLIIR